MDGQTPPLTFTLNGQPVSAHPAQGARLSETLREELGARGVKIGCNAGDCGACTVLMDGEPVCACLVPTAQAEGARIDTAAGLMAADPVAQALGARMLDHGAAQCGICTPGMMVSAVALLRAVPQPTEEQVSDALGGVLCRCTGYRKIIDAVRGVTPGLHGDGAVGDAVRRVDGDAKLTGAEAYGDDIAPAGTLEILVIRSPHPHAAFTLGDLDAFAQRPGIHAVLTAADVTGVNRFGVIPAFADQPVFAEGVARFRGEAVAAIVATPEAIRALDPAAFPVTWSPLPAALDPKQAAQTADLHAGRKGNAMVSGFVTCGDPEAALARADVVVDGTYGSGFVEHAYIEPEAGFARLVGDTVEIHACTQAPVMDQESTAEILGWDKARVRIIPTGVGGGFGSKLDISVQPILALGAIKTGQPVRLTYTRTESMQSTTKRHPSDIRLRIGATKDGKISGMVFDGIFDTGAYASWGPTVAVRVPVHASGPYRIADYRAKATGVHTHNPPSGAFRGFGVPQAAIAQEQAFDQLAERLGIDPLAFRLANVLDNGARTVCGQVFDTGVGARACLQALQADWDRERAAAQAFNAANAGVKRGVGVALGWYGCGNTSLPNPSTIKVGVRADGTLVLHQGAMDIGQGANTVIAQIFAQALGVPLSAVTRIGPDTAVTPDAGKTSASRQTFVSGNAARLSGLALRAAILRHVNAAEDATLTLGAGQITVTDAAGAHVIALAGLPADADGYVFHAAETYDPPTKPMDKNGQGAPYAQYGYAAQLAVVQVDMALGTVKPLRVVAAHDVGRAINPMLVEGQVQGGVAQGLGMALMEEYIPGRTENLHDYLIPTIGDVPPIDTIIVEEPDAHGPYGAKGLGEHALIPTAPAILNAIAHATGVRVTRVPATPSVVLKGISDAR